MNNKSQKTHKRLKPTTKQKNKGRPRSVQFKGKFRSPQAIRNWFEDKKPKKKTPKEK